MPELTNAERAQRAQLTLQVYVLLKQDGTDYTETEAIVDLLADAMHLFAQGEPSVGVLEIEFDIARDHFYFEQAEEFDRAHETSEKPLTPA